MQLAENGSKFGGCRQLGFWSGCCIATLRVCSADLTGEQSVYCTCRVVRGPWHSADVRLASDRVDASEPSHVVAAQEAAAVRESAAVSVRIMLLEWRRLRAQWWHGCHVMLLEPTLPLSKLRPVGLTTPTHLALM